MAVNFAALNTVHNHYLATYAPKNTSSFDAHKKSELRNIYNSIVKLNKDSPLYMISDTNETKSYAIELKENARQLQHTIHSLGDSKQELLNKKAAYSSNPSIAEVKMVGSLPKGMELPPLDLEVKSLASSQVNMGRLLDSSKTVDLEPNTYSFDIIANGLNYEFQFNINSGDTNKDVTNRLSRLINNAGINLKAKSIEDADDNISLKIESTSIGKSNHQDELFYISDEHTSKAMGVVDYLGIGDITRHANNATFSVNGVNRSATSNNFMIEKMFEVSLHDITPEAETISIGVENDAESLVQNIEALTNGYNDFLQTTLDHSIDHPRSNALLRELKHITNSFHSSFESVGINILEDGTLSLDIETLKQSAFTGNTEEILTSTRDFANAMIRKSENISLDPMHYVEKTVVAYKPPVKNFPAPYVTSLYSGMLFNSYC